MAALGQLGYPRAYHMVNIIRNPRDSIMWREALDAKYNGKGEPFTREDWDCLLGEAQVHDHPSLLFAVGEDMEQKWRPAVCKEGEC